MNETHPFVRERAYELIVELIFHPEFDRTQPLSERKLAERFGLGRMPIREALRQLEQEGVVKVQPARGTFVQSLEQGDLMDVYRVREVLECAVVEDVARRDMPRALRAIGTTLAVMARDPNSFSAAEIDDAGTEFHGLMVEATGNLALSETIRLFRGRFRLAFHLPRYFSRQLAIGPLNEHLQIFDALEARDPQAAAVLMREHLRNGVKMRLTLGSGTPADPEESAAINPPRGMETNV